MANFNPIPQNQVIFSHAGPYTLRTPAGQTITTRDPPLSEPSTKTLIGTNPNNILIEEEVGPQRIA